MTLRSLQARKRPKLFERLGALLKNSRVADYEALEELEEILVSADAGVETALRITGMLEKKKGEGLLPALREALLGVFGDKKRDINTAVSGPTVIMLAGVNGTGKTTTAGKLALHFRKQGRKVLMAAADTFRAGAVEQLEVWAERAGAGIVKHRDGADPSAVAYDSAEAAIARKVDVLIIDTAGRLHTSANLMEELKKIMKVAGKKIPGAPHETMLVLDASTGQNALAQARVFFNSVELTSSALVKLDGTAKGGIVLAVENELGIPVKMVGTGENIEDLERFDPAAFIDSLLK